MAPDKKLQFQEQLPGVYFLDHADIASLGAYLAGCGRLAPGEALIAAEKAGEGNMNCTVRARTSLQRSFIVKQSRPWLEKYPAVAAPFDRTIMEGRFYQLVQGVDEVSSRMPRLLWMDAVNRVIAFEDLGAASDFFPLYSREAILDGGTLGDLVDYLSALHAMPLDAATAGSLRNSGMRALNHEHIFDLPLRIDHGLDADVYTPGLAAVGERIKRDRDYRRIAAELGERYLHGCGNHLVHGDFFPGSFLRTAAGVRVIDPEFCFCGDAEFDLGVFYGHLLLAGEPAALADRMLALYRPANKGGEAFRPDRVRQYAGIEIMRRLLGLAQIPTLAIDLERKTELLELSRQLVVEP
jgi:5-methylthioribose kinase